MLAGFVADQGFVHAGHLSVFHHLLPTQIDMGQTGLGRPVDQARDGSAIGFERRQIPQEDVGALAGLEAAEFGFEPERAGSVDRRHLEYPSGG